MQITYETVALGVSKWCLEMDILSIYMASRMWLVTFPNSQIACLWLGLSSVTRSGKLR